MCFNIGNVVSDLKSTPSFGKMWDSFGEIDPLLHGAIDDQSKLDDRVTGAVLGGVGLNGPAKYFDKEAQDPTQAAMQHVLAGVAWAGGEAALGAGGAGAGGGAAADSGSVNLFADAVPGAGGDVGASAGTGAVGTSGASAGGAGSSWMDYAKTAAKTLGPALVSSALQPKPPKAAPVAAMPDPLAQEQAQRQKIIDQMARRGRASTILTSATNGTLGG